MNFFAPYSSPRQHQRGFILIATMVILSLLTIMSVGLFYRSRINQQSSYAARDGIQAFYYAETGINYLVWALNPQIGNDVNFDTSVAGGDYSNMNTESASFPGSKLLRVPNNFVKYFDGRSCSTRVSAASGGVFYFGPDSPAEDLTNALPPSFLKMSVNKATQAVTISSVTNTTLPSKLTAADGDGAALWITAAYTDPYTTGCTAGAKTCTPCSAVTSSGVADSDAYFPSNPAAYKLVFYSLGFINGKPLRLLRRSGVVSVGPLP